MMGPAALQSLVGMPGAHWCPPLLSNAQCLSVPRSAHCSPLPSAWPHGGQQYPGEPSLSRPTYILEILFPQLWVNFASVYIKMCQSTVLEPQEATVSVQLKCSKGDMEIMAQQRYEN